MRILLTSLIAALLFALPAQAQMIEKLTVANVSATLDELGLQYAETTDNRGFPLIQIARDQPGGTFAARNINIFFYGCGATGCEDITLYSWYQPRTRPSSATLNQWNDIFQHTRNWSRAYIDEEGDPVLIMNINATGGIGIEALQILVNTYLVECEDFADTLNPSAPQ